MQATLTVAALALGAVMVAGALSGAASLPHPNHEATLRMQEPVQPTSPKPLPGTYRTSWVGNSFGGDGGPNGFGYWVQNAADEIEVTPDGTVIAGLTWDEAGRCVGLYRDGKVNRTLLKAEGDDLANSAWGWGTGNNAVAVWGETIYVATTGKKLLRFHWTPGDLESATFQDATDMETQAIGLNARGSTLAVVYPDRIELRRTEDLKATGKFAVAQARDVAVASDGSLWVLAGNTVQRYGADGKPGQRVPGLENPSAVSFDNRGRLIVCEDGPRQQVLFFDIQSAPKLVATFGEKGGLRAGVPGKLAPRKLFALRGAGTDAQGNLYVAMSFASAPEPPKENAEKKEPAITVPLGAPVGNLFLRSFTPGGDLRWDLHSTTFVDTYGFDPDSDGSVIYSRTAVFNLDLNKTQPGSEARLRAVTLDHVRNPKDDRIRYGGTAMVRRLQGKRVLYFIGQYAGGYRIYTFDEPNGHLATEVDRIGGSEQWAWDVGLNGDIWHGDAPNKTIRRYPFQGWTADGKPRYDWDKPQTWDVPDGWQLIRRILYDDATDTLYLTGYRDGERVETWGVAGATVARYDNWLRGNRTPAKERKPRWTAPLPRDGNTDKNEGPLTPSSVDIAGDYLFAGMVKPTEGKQFVHVLRLSDGGFVGTFIPGKETGESHGWLDMPYSMQAMRRKNGEYLILVEEDFRGKNLLYRWKP
ncbi:MAG: hypothetical protein OHK0029_19000 [Armatimonadaceae bacterium]